MFVIPGRLQLDFLPASALKKPLNTNDPEAKARYIVSQALSTLMMGWPQKAAHASFSWDFFRAVFVARDPELLCVMRAVFQEAFFHIYDQLKNKQLTPEAHAQAALYLSNCLNILPFSDLTPHESIQIPQYINNQWILVDYAVVPIELTPTAGIERLFISEHDRVFAYGLEPIQHDNAKPHLIFMGTTYPAGQGLSSQLYTDFEAFETAGNHLYRTGRERIRTWLNQQAHKVEVSGMSLGGSLALLLAIDQGEKLSRVTALNPFGLYNAWRKSRYDNWDKLCQTNQAPVVYIQKQGDDPISALGVWKKEWQVLHVVPPKNKQGPNGVIDHALNYAGFADTRFIAVDVAADNRERRVRDYLIYVLLRSFIYYTLMCPYRYLIQPVLRYIHQHVFDILIVLGVFALLPFVSTALSSILVGLSIGFVAYCVLKDVMSMVQMVLAWEPVKPLPAHQLDAPRNKSMDIYKNTATAIFSRDALQTYARLNKRSFFHAETHQETSKGLVEVTVTKAEMYDMTRTLRVS